jgi:hypothetical protein
MGRKTILRHLVRRSNPYATSLKFLEEEWKEDFSNTTIVKLRGT